MKVKSLPPTSKGKISWSLTIVYKVIVGVHFLLTLWLTFFFSSTVMKQGHYLLGCLLFPLGVTYYILLREGLYKLIHVCGYHAQAQLKSFGAGSKKISFPVFEKHTEEYKVCYRKRSKWHQFLYLVSLIIYINIVNILLVLGGLCALFFILYFELNGLMLLLPLVLLVIFGVGLLSLFDSYKQWFQSYHRLTVLFIEHEYPIYFKEDVAEQIYIHRR